MILESKPLHKKKKRLARKNKEQGSDGSPQVKKPSLIDQVSLPVCHCSSQKDGRRFHPAYLKGNTFPLSLSIKCVHWAIENIEGTFLELSPPSPWAEWMVRLSDECTGKARKAITCSPDSGSIILLWRSISINQLSSSGCSWKDREEITERLIWSAGQVSRGRIFLHHSWLRCCFWQHLTFVHKYIKIQNTGRSIWHVCCWAALEVKEQVERCGRENRRNMLLPRERI